MQNNLHDYMESHPDVKGIIGLILMGWLDEYGEDIIVDVSETDDEAAQRMAFYQSHGYKLKDESGFGCWDNKMGILQCFIKQKDSN